MASRVSADRPSMSDGVRENRAASVRAQQTWSVSPSPPRILHPPPSPHPLIPAFLGFSDEGRDSGSVLVPSDATPKAAGFNWD